MPMWVAWGGFPIPLSDLFQHRLQFFVGKLASASQLGRKILAQELAGELLWRHSAAFSLGLEPRFRLLIKFDLNRHGSPPCFYYPPNLPKVLNELSARAFFGSCADCEGAPRPSPLGAVGPGSKALGLGFGLAALLS